MACKHRCPGPRDWITADALRELRALGFPEAMKDLESTAVAAKARVVQ